MRRELIDRLSVLGIKEAAQPAGLAGRPEQVERAGVRLLDDPGRRSEQAVGHAEFRRHDRDDPLAGQLQNLINQAETHGTSVA